jgi:hypothetical protein
VASVKTQHARDCGGRASKMDPLTARHRTIAAFVQLGLVALLLPSLHFVMSGALSFVESFHFVRLLALTP